MKFEIIAFTAVIILSVSTPFTAYFSLGNSFDLHASIMKNSASGYEILANEIEPGKVRAYVESIPKTLRHLAKAEHLRARALEDYQSATTNFFTASLGAASVQELLLIGLILRRRNITNRPVA